MRTQHVNISKPVFAAILIASLVVFSACGTKQKQMNAENELTSLSVKKPSPPELDIHSAVVMGDLKTVRQHIKAGSDLNVREMSAGSTPLISAAVFGKTEIAKALIEAGADLNLQNNDGSTALHSAAFFCRLEIVKALLEGGAETTLKNNFGSTALESVSGPFDDVKDIYAMFNKNLGPLGFKLDYVQLEESRPIVAEMLK